jgi:glycerate kinase
MTRRVLIAPDKFKGSLTAPQVAQAIATGWRRARPEDELTLLPMADGGDGTAVVVALGAWSGGEWVMVPTVDALGRPHAGWYLRAGDTAVVELALACGIAQLEALDPMGSHTIGLGIVIGAALRAGVDRLVVGLGGSASTDGGAGALSALGARFIGRDGVLPVGGAGLARLAAIALDGLIPLPRKGVEVWVDVRAPLCGPLGAAAVFGPQKGASADQVAALQRGLVRFAELLGGSPDAAGAGAAGGTGYGLACWGATLVPGAAAVASAIGLPAALSHADIVVTGEGRFDRSSMTGKACGYVIAEAGAARSFVIAGSVGDGCRGDRVLSLTELAGSETAAVSDPAYWIAEAASLVAAS